MPARGIQGTKGVRKVRWTSGRVRRSTMTARQMIIKAESVPTATSLIGKKPATSAASPPAISVGRGGRAEANMNRFLPSIVHAYR
jgi:hypothetical protein